MYKQQPRQKETLKGNKTVEGETMEAKVRRIISSKEPISDSSPIIYTERKDGVQPQYNIRTDRWEHAVEAMDVNTKASMAKREFRIGERSWDTMTPEQQQNHIKLYPHSKFNKGETNQQS